MNKQLKLVPDSAVPKPLTEEQKKLKVMQFLQQKRENFSISILCALCHGAGNAKSYATLKDPTTKLTIDTDGLVDKAVEMADQLLEKLYPLPETKDMSNN